MKRPNREINVFSMSALDLFASALGAFIVIALVMSLYFLNTTTAAEGPLRYLAVILTWDNERTQDLDLVIHGPDSAEDGNREYHEYTQGPGARHPGDVRASLGAGIDQGPGPEVWWHLGTGEGEPVTPGRYEVFVFAPRELFGEAVNPCVRVIYPTGQMDVGVRGLTLGRRGRESLATILVERGEPEPRVERGNGASDRCDSGI